MLHSNYWIQYSVIYEPIEFRCCYFESASFVNLLAALNFANVFKNKKTSGK